MGAEELEPLPEMKPKGGGFNKKYLGIAVVVIIVIAAVYLVFSGERLIATAHRTGQPELCGDVTDPTEKDLCYYLFAMDRQDAGLCENILESSRVDACYFSIAQMTSNPALCENVAYEESRENCIREAGGAA